MYSAAPVTGMNTRGLLAKYQEKPAPVTTSVAREAPVERGISPLRGYNDVDTMKPAVVDPNPLLALRPNPPTSKQPLIPAPPVRVDATIDTAELDALRMKLRAQTAGSAATPPRTMHYAEAPTPPTTRPAVSARPASAVCGSQFVDVPYKGIQSTMRHISDDEEISNLMAQIRARENRISMRNKELERAWQEMASRPSTGSIRPPDPPVMQAADQDVIRRAEELNKKDPSPAAAPSPNALQKITSQPFAPAAGAPDAAASSIDAKRVMFNSNNTNSNTSSNAIGETSHNNLGTSFISKGDLMKRRTSAVKVSDATVAILSLFDHECNVDVVLPGPEDVINVREGDVLSQKTILKRDLFDAAFTRKDQVGVMAGAPYFRMVPKFNVGGVAQAHASGIRAALNEVRKVYRAGPIVWVNLREEPVIYINGRSHIIRGLDNPTKPMTIAGITGSRIAAMEYKLRTELLAEATRNGGNICVHKESNNGSIDMLWEAVEEESVATIVEVFDYLNQKGYDVQYFRQPLTQGIGPQPADFQYVFNLCMMFPHAPIIYNCQTGRGRSSIMMVITTIVKFYQFCTKDINIDVTLMNGDGRATSFRTILKLISLLPDGNLHERRVAILAELSDKIYSINDHVHAAFKSRDVSQNALYRLRQYAYLICFSCFCEQQLWTKTFKGSFSDWIDSLPDIKTLLNNIVQQPKFQAAVERIETPVGEDHEVAAVIRKRRGNALSSNMILRSQPRDTGNVAQTTIPGVVALRQLCPGVPIFTCGRATEQGRNDLLYTIRLNFPDITGIQWISTRDEPMVFINDTGYSLLDYSALHQNENSSESMMHISAERIEELERKLLNDVLAEAEQYNGYIIVHEMKSKTETIAKKIKVQKVHAPRTVMDDFAENNDVTYIRMPMPVDWQANPADFDALLQHIATSMDDNEAVVINDTDGALRTTMVLSYITVVRAARVRRLREIKTVNDLIFSLNGGDPNGKLIGSNSRTYFGFEEDEKYANITMPELQVASSICQMLAAGSLLSTTQAIIGCGGRGPEWNILDALEVAVEEMQRANGDQRQLRQHRALETARKYLMVLLVVLYIDDQKGFNPAMPLSRWCNNLKEIDNVLKSFEERPQVSLKFVVKDNLMAGHSKDRAVDRRSGDVLTANFGMKADHFPGCQKKGLVPVVSGAPNFRKVDVVNVYGVAIPTRVGVSNILAVLGASDKALVALPGETNDENMAIAYPSPKVFDPKFNQLRLSRPLRGSVIWVNLREEPIIYVGDRPFVFRDLALPYVNVELTGIESTKVEHVERKLKMDILNEAARYDGQFLVHDEGKPGELVGIWEEANDDTVKTVRDIYEDLAEHGARVKFLRLPVTDEQSPELKDFDSLVLALLPELIATTRSNTDPVSFVFNCQMGRGRTTTGMVVCCLLIGLVLPEYYDELIRKYPKLYPDGASRFANGEYAAIVQLRSVLNNGRKAKHHVDLVLEACDKMQNLRTAIEVLKKQVESVDFSEEARGRAHLHGVHYLQRYFNLIAFASYLDEEFNRSTCMLSMPFADWMEMRPELVHMHDQAQLE